MTNEAGFLGGIDSHKDSIHVVVITELGVEVDGGEFCATQYGYRAARRVTFTRCVVVSPFRPVCAVHARRRVGSTPRLSDRQRLRGA